MLLKESFKYIIEVASIVRQLCYENPSCALTFCFLIFVLSNITNKALLFTRFLPGVYDPLLFGIKT